MKNKEQTPKITTIEEIKLGIATFQAEQKGRDEAFKEAEARQIRYDKQDLERAKEKNRERGKKSAETRKEMDEARKEFFGSLMSIWNLLESLKEDIDNPELCYTPTLPILESMDEKYWEIRSFLINLEFTLDRYKLVLKPLNERLSKNSKNSFKFPKRI